jgi:peptidyl-prolyl cis-trans isomerase B (cyclophilin B)
MRERAVRVSLIALLTVASATACASASRPSTSGSTASGECHYTKSARSAAKNVGRPPSAITSPTPNTATLTTNHGVITLRLNAGAAPCTVNSFTFLAGQHYFDSTSCHRLTTSGIFVLQCGDPTGTGAGGPGYRFADENLRGATYSAGTVAMANAGPGTNGSQFFLVYADTKLAPKYTPFATITAGLDVVRTVAAAGSNNSNGPGDGAPLLPTTIEQVVTAGAS